MHYYVVRCTESILHMLINIYFITKKSFYTFNSLDNKVVQHILRSQAVLLLCSLSPPLKMQVCLFFLHQYPLYQSRKVDIFGTHLFTAFLNKLRFFREYSVLKCVFSLQFSLKKSLPVVYWCIISQSIARTLTIKFVEIGIALSVSRQIRVQ